MIRAVKGTRDLLPPATAVWNHVETVAREVFRAYNYHEIRTPILEETQLFARGVGAETDIVTKEMYTFEDRDGSSLTLRPETTASVMRAYIEHRLDQRPGVQKLYYIGPMFRRERPQKGRYRQFFQIGAEAIGSESPLVDAEVIEMVVELLKRAGLGGFTLLLNSVGDSNCRPAVHRDAAGRAGEGRAEVVRGLPAARDYESAARARLQSAGGSADHRQTAVDSRSSREVCRRHFDTVQSLLRDRGIPFEVRPRLVRGLDYYMRTTFEVVHGALGAQNSVLGGGRYDGLAESLGSKVPAPGIGFSIGEDRLVMTVEERLNSQPLDLFVAALGEPAMQQAGLLARDLRQSGHSVEVVADAKLKRAMELANKLGARYTLIVGENEIAAGRYALKNMASGQQEEVAREEIAQRLQITH